MEFSRVRVKKVRFENQTDKKKKLKIRKGVRRHRLCERKFI